MMAADAEKTKKFLESLPSPIRQHVEKLRGLQKQCDGLKQDYEKERKALEEKYMKLQEPIFDERAQVIAGNSAPETNGENKAPGNVPGFWLKVLSSSVTIGDHISEKDEAVLNYLKDIRVESLFNRGFKLVFHFWPNPFFAHDVLTKSYIMEEDDEAMLERTEGFDIEWNEGMNPGIKVMKKKAKRPGESPEQKVSQVHSFFDLFSPPKLPESDEEEDVTVDELAELHAIAEEDFEIGMLIQQMIVPNAVLWYTGEIIEAHDSELDSDNGEEASSEEN